MLPQRLLLNTSSICEQFQKHSVKTKRDKQNMNQNILVLETLDWLLTYELSHAYTMQLFLFLGVELLGQTSSCVQTTWVIFGDNKIEGACVIISVVHLFHDK